MSREDIKPETVVRISASLGHDKDEVIAGLQDEYGMTWNDAAVLVVREYTRRQVIDDMDAADAEFDT